MCCSAKRFKKGPRRSSEAHTTWRIISVAGFSSATAGPLLGCACFCPLQKRHHCGLTPAVPPAVGKKFTCFEVFMFPQTPSPAHGTKGLIWEPLLQGSQGAGGQAPCHCGQWGQPACTVLAPGIGLTPLRGVTWSPQSKPVLKNNLAWSRNKSESNHVNISWLQADAGQGIPEEAAVVAEASP